MSRIATIAASIIFCLGAGPALAQASAKTPGGQQPGPSQESQQGSKPEDIGVIELDVITPGWSAKKDIMGKPVYNDQNQRIGKIDDIIITPDNAVSFAIIGAGGFLGIGKHDVVIPVDHIQSVNNRYVLPGATKATLKALPAFKYKAQ